ncbi:F-box protein At1g30790-like [Raphanus sativus]|uniref:F-box protein At1g30790-like n=1 Tax=Raphanus sativus TaxID=3726 RepID=A0A6J0MU65_RAPSA|nr:F-box protein At1g30790-like [Raphanus sativus]
MEDSQVPSPSRNLDHAVNHTRNIPLDLVLDILSRLPAKPILRFQAVSKLWFSIIRSKYFVDTFLTRSKTRPRLLLTFKHSGSRKRFIFSAPEPEDGKIYSTVMARHDMTISDLVYDIESRPLNGLVCCARGSSIAVCNPTTRQIVKLPDEHFVFTLGSQQKKWKKIESEAVTKDPYRCMKGEVCIDGFIYYGVGYSRIARFDVTSEKIEFIQVPKDYNAVSCYSRLITCQGKLACFSYDFYGTSEMYMWILQDAEKQEWSSIVICDVYSELREFFTDERLLCTGEIHTNEAILVSRSLNSSELFSVYYCDMISKRVRRAEVDGITDDEFRGVHGICTHGREVLCSPGHVENIMFF